MGKIKVILWDIDGTLLDFIAAQRAAIRALFKKFNLGECDDTMLADYSAINQEHWHALERGEITKPQVLTGRFYEFFTKYDIPTDCVESFNAEYQIRLGDTICFLPNSNEILNYCKDSNILQYGATNGTKIAQERKLKLSGLDKIFETTFISDIIGYEKPTTGFFDYALDVIKQSCPSITKSEILIVGDSLTSDIKGGIDYGIQTCWLNTTNQTTELKPTYIINNLIEIKEIILLQ